MGLDSCNLINDTAIQKILEANNSDEQLQTLSHTFAFNEPVATLAIADVIKARIKTIKELKPDLDLSTEVENACWMMFLLGYEVGRKTHSYNLEEIQ